MLDSAKVQLALERARNPDGTPDYPRLLDILSLSPDDPVCQIVDLVLEAASIRDQIAPAFAKSGHDLTAKITTQFTTEIGRLSGPIRRSLAEWDAQRDTLREWLKQATQEGKNDRATMIAAVASLQKDNTALRVENQKLQKFMTELSTALEAERIQRAVVVAEAQGLKQASQEIIVTLQKRRVGDVLWGLVGSLLLAAALSIVVFARTAR